MSTLALVLLLALLGVCCCGGGGNAGCCTFDCGTTFFGTWTAGPACLTGSPALAFSCSPTTPWTTGPFTLCAMVGANQLSLSCDATTGVWTLHEQTSCTPPSCCFPEPGADYTATADSCEAFTLTFSGIVVDESCGAPAGTTTTATLVLTD